MKDCHQIIQKDNFNPNIIKSSKKLNFNRFSKILKMSHIMNADTAQSSSKVFRLKNDKSVISFRVNTFRVIHYIKNISVELLYIL